MCSLLIRSCLCLRQPTPLAFNEFSRFHSSLGFIDCIKQRINTIMSSQAKINKLVERYPFNNEELEQLIRCHAALLDVHNTDSFLTKIALSSPYSYFFLPGNEMRRRIELVENKILPEGFGSCLRAAMSVDLFVDCANEGQDLTLERFLEGVADCGQRGHKEALRVIWDCCSYLGGFEDELKPGLIVDLCYRLAFAAGEFINVLRC